MIKSLIIKLSNFKWSDLSRSTFIHFVKARKTGFSGNERAMKNKESEEEVLRILANQNLESERILVVPSPAEKARKWLKRKFKKLLIWFLIGWKEVLKKQNKSKLKTQ